MKLAKFFENLTIHLNLFVIHCKNVIQKYSLVSEKLRLTSFKLKHYYIIEVSFLYAFIHCC